MSSYYVLVFNCGSSSIKFSIVNPDSEVILMKGIVQCIGTDQANLTWDYQNHEQHKSLVNVDYKTAIVNIISLIKATDGLEQSIVAVGHRVVHGGEYFTDSVLINEETIQKIQSCNNLAPLHNPVNLIGINVAQKELPHLPQVAVFDTAFHQTMPKYAYIYAIPYQFYEDYAVRRYGFHGTSHRYVTQKAAEILHRPIEKSAYISAHLGNGCSVAAVLNGRSVDTSMGLTPLEGLVMGTRSGDIDPSVHAYLADQLGVDVHQITKILNRESGLLGVSGVDSDMRNVTQAAESGNKRAQLAIDIFCYRLAKYIMGSMIPLGRIDALIFTGGIGEHASLIRKQVVQWLHVIQFELNEQRNFEHGKKSHGIITSDTSQSLAIVIPTQEELMIAKDAIALI